MATLVLDRASGRPTTRSPAARALTRAGRGFLTRLVDAFVASRMARVEHEVSERLGKSLTELREDADRRYQAL